MRIYAALYDAFAIATAVTLVCVRSITICMHVNMGALFLGALSVCVVAFLLVFRTMRAHRIRWVSFIVLAVCVLATIALYAFVFPQHLAMQPAMALRLAFGLHSTPPPAIGIIVPAALVAGIIPLVRLTSAK